MLRFLPQLITFYGLLFLSTAAPTVNNNQLSDNDHLGLNRYDLPDFSSTSSDVDIEKTVSQVEQILKLNPNLPRLSKEDILTLLNNITSEDNLKANKEAESIVNPEIEKGRTDSNKNNKQMTMVVLPYKPEDTSNGDVTELFTKAPKIRFEPPKESKPIVVPDIDEEDDENEENDKTHPFKNHKYSNENTKTSNIKNKPDNFWKNQAQKVMEDLEKQNEPNKIVLDIPFKKMPNVDIPSDFDKNNDFPNDFEPVDFESINKLLNENKDGPTAIGYSGAFKPLALTEFQSLPEPVTNFELILPKEDNSETLIANPSSSFINDKLASQNLYAPSDISVEDYNGGEKKLDYSISPKVDSAAYMSFKPLPTKESSNGANKELDLDKILQEYGIYDYIDKSYLPVNSNESSSEIGKDAASNTDYIETDMLPASMASMLTDMGLTKKKGRKMDEKKNEDSYAVEAPSPIDTKYGINPMDDEEMKDLYESLNMIKREMDEKSTEAEVKEIKKDDVKESTSDKEEISDTEKLNSEDDSKESDKGPSLAALEESFGASPADKDPSEAILPPPRRNGFYYMVDWNSFFQVDGSNGKSVNIRFEPKLGDPQMFIFGKKN